MAGSAGPQPCQEADFRRHGKMVGQEAPFKAQGHLGTSSPPPDGKQGARACSRLRFPATKRDPRTRSCSRNSDTGRSATFPRWHHALWHADSSCSAQMATVDQGRRVEFPCRIRRGDKASTSRTRSPRMAFIVPRRHLSKGHSRFRRRTCRLCLAPSAFGQRRRRMALGRVSTGTPRINRWCRAGSGGRRRTARLLRHRRRR